MLPGLGIYFGRTQRCGRPASCHYGINRLLLTTDNLLGRSPITEGVLHCLFRYKGEAAKLRNLSQLRHVDPYQVSISPDGTEVVVSLCRSATLDAQYLVRNRLDGLLRAAGVCSSMFRQQLAGLQTT